MCIVIKYKDCVGRNFDYEKSFKEIPKMYDKEKYKIWGMCTGLIKDYPLYYDAVNEHGLFIAGLNFEGNAHYRMSTVEKDINIPSWDLPIQILGNCKTVEEVKEYLKNANITGQRFNNDLPNSELHWFICDKDKSIVVEQTVDKGLSIYDNPYDILTNNPPFDDIQKIIKNRDSVIISKFRKLYNKLIPKECVTRGTETLGLTGDLTSIGRFKRANFYLNKLYKSNTKFSNHIETFHLLDTVKQVYGATPVGDKFEYTIYEVVYDLSNMMMYIKPYKVRNSISIDLKNGRIGD